MANSTLDMSKVQVLDRPILQPANCAVCQAQQYDGRRWVDFGLDLDWFGVVYICTKCLDEVYRVLDWSTVTSIAQMDHHIEQKSQELKELLLELDNTRAKLKETKNELEQPKSDNHSTSVFGNLGSVSSDSKKRIADSKKQQRIDEQTSESGLKDIPELADVLKPKSSKAGILFKE